MNSNWKSILFAIGCLTLLSTARLKAQSVDVLSPTVVPARFTASESPFTQSTRPLGDAPEGVTTYFWPEKESSAIENAPRANTAKVASVPPAVSRTSYRPTNELPPANQTAASSLTRAQTVPAAWTTQVQYAPPTSLQPGLPSATDNISPLPSGGVPCYCVPVGQPNYSYLAPQMTYAYRPSLPVSQLPGNYYFGRGLIGQPKVYVPGQPLRNAIRYISP